MAQLGARFHGMEEVIGSIPIRSTNKPFNTNYLPALPDRLQLRRRCRSIFEAPGNIVSTTFALASRFYCETARV